MKINYLIIVSLFAIIGCSGVTPNGDQEAVLIKKPWFFGSGGVDQTPISSGLTWTALSTDEITFKITPENYSEEFHDMMTHDNTPISFSASLKLQIVKGETPKLYKNFGENWFEKSIQPTFRSLVRDKVNSYKMFDLAGNRTVLKEVEESLFSQISEYCKGLNIPVNVLQVVIGAATPPKEVLEETRRTAAQNQSILTQTARAKAEAARKDAEINKAIADKAYRQEMGMNNEEYMKLRGLEIEKEKVELVREKNNVSIIMGQGIVPTFNVGHK